MKHPSSHGRRSESHFPTVSDSTFTERQGVHHVGLTASQMGFVWRETPNTDLGIDGYLEVTVNGAPIGLIAVQVKSGQSYLGKPDDDAGFTFRAEKRHVRYWLNYRLPVFILVYDPLKQVAYWHYIQDYYQEHSKGPSGTGKVPIRILKSAVFDASAKERIAEIAASPDSTAHAMLALRASRYNRTNELLTQAEMLELYTKRWWLGEWLPLDKASEQLLFHSTLARRGPGWFWFRIGINRQYIPYLRDALSRPETELRREASLALAVAIQREAVNDLRKYLTTGSDVFSAAKSLASIPDLSNDERQLVSEDCWKQLQDQAEKNLWDLRIKQKLLGVIARIGGVVVRNQILDYYIQSYNAPYPPPFQEAGYLWAKQELPLLRVMFERGNSIMRSFIVSALAQLGEQQDINLILDYMNNISWIDEDDLVWLSKGMAHLFESEDLEHLRQMIQADHTSQVVAHRGLDSLCCRLDEKILRQLLADPSLIFRRYAAKGLVAIGKPEILAEHEEYLSVDTATDLAYEVARGMAAAGNWEAIDRIMKSDRTDLQIAIANGLRFISDSQKLRACDYLFLLLQSPAIDILMRLEAGGSLAVLGDESTLQNITEWLAEHIHEDNVNMINVIASVLNYLDRRLYCPIHLPLNSGEMKSDFSMLHRSVTRDDYR